MKRNATAPKQSKQARPRAKEPRAKPQTKPTHAKVRKTSATSPEKKDLFAPPKPNLFPIGSHGVKRVGGRVADEFLKDLDGLKAIKMYTEMSTNEPVIGVYLLLVDLLMRQTPHTVEAPKGTGADGEAQAEFIRQCIEDVRGGMGGFKSSVVTSLTYGAAVIEKVHKIRRGSHPLKELNSRFDDGRFGLRELALRPMDTLDKWEFDADGDATHMVQKPPPPDNVIRYIDLKRCVHVIPFTRKNSPQGQSILRVPYISYYHKKHIQFVESVGVERDLAGYPVMEVPVSMTTSQDPETVAALTSQKEMVRSIKRDEYEGVVIPAEQDANGPTGFRLRLLNSGGRRPTDVDAIIRRHESRMAISLLCEFVLLGMDKHGSFALSSDKTDIFAMGVRAVLDLVDEAWNCNIIPELMTLNNVPEKLWPKLKHGDIEKVDPVAFASALSTLASSSAIVVDDAVEDKAREVIGVPPRATSAIAIPTQPLPISDPYASGAQPAQTDAVPVAETALNGAQVASLQALLTSVANGELPKATVREMIIQAFQLQPDQADRMLAPIVPLVATNTPPAA